MNDDPQTAETARELRRKLASAERIRENADFHLGQEMARRQLAEKEATRLRAVVARVAQMADAWEQRLPEVIRTPAVVSALRAALEAADGPSRLAAETPQPETQASASPSNRRALVHNAITDALSAAGDWVPLSTRIAATRAALAEVDAWHADDPTPADEAQQQPEKPEMVHACPPDGSGLTPCCGRTPFELPRTDRMSTDPAAVTCQPAAVQADGEAEPGPRAVCVCGHIRAEHLRIGGPFGQGRLLCDSCDPDSTDNLGCKEFEAL